MFLTTIILLVCLVLGYLIVCRRFLPRENDLVPTCPGKLPIVGHSHLLLNSETLLRNILSFGEYTLKVGDVAKFYLGPLPVYVVTDPVDVTTILNKCLKKMFVYDFCEPMLGKMVICADVPVWKRNRRIMDLSFKQHVLDDFLEVFNDRAGRLADLLSEDAGKGPVDLTDKITRSILETACQTTLGARVDGKALVDDNFIKATHDLLDILMTRIQKPWLIFDFIFNMSSYQNKLTEALGNVTKVTKQMVELRKSEHLQRLINKEDFHNEGKSQSFLESLIENTVTQTSSLYTDEELRNITDNILVGAFDTSINQLMFAIACIGSYPEIQEKIYQEITQVLGEDGRVTKQNISQLVNLEAAIKESLRLYPIGGIVGRETTVDTELRNATIPAGSSVVVHIWSVNRNTDYWGSDPEEFKPERWLSPDTMPRHKAAFASFSPGLRGCIGKHYAVMYLKAALASLLRNFKFTADHTQIKMKCEVFLKPESGHLVTIEKRQSNK